MKDWQGNEIKVGMTLLRVQVKDMFAGSTMTAGMGIRKEDGEWDYQELGKFDVPDKPLWIIKEKCVITELHGNFVVSFNESIITHYPLNIAESFFQPQFYEIICIEGVSDNELDYVKYINKIA